MIPPTTRSRDPLRLAARSRREFFQRSAVGLGAVALQSLFGPSLFGQSAPGRGPHFTPRAKRVIFLFMAGGPSHVDLFDPKPKLTKHAGQAIPAEYVKGIEFGFIDPTAKLLASPYAFSRHGQAGMDFSDQVPHLAGVADELTMIRGMVTDEFNHSNAQLLFANGFRRVGRPSMGAWVTYGLGAENENLPGFVVLSTGAGNNAGNALWSAGFLPTEHQGVRFASEGDPVPSLANPAGVTPALRRRSLQTINQLNRTHLADFGDPEIAARMNQYELAFRMQESVPVVMDLAGESARTLEAYGAKPGASSFANNCLLARRLVERGVRFVQLIYGSWDQHSGLYQTMPRLCQRMDRPVAALIRDLRERGLLDDTIVVWSGEFGRTPMVQDIAPDGMMNAGGRDHHKDAFTAWVAGGGFKRGLVHGETDDFGCRVVRDPVHVHDLQATLLHQLGIDHTRLTYRYQGRDYRLTDVHGHVIKELLA